MYSLLCNHAKSSVKSYIPDHAFGLEFLIHRWRGVKSGGVMSMENGMKAEAARGMKVYLVNILTLK